MGSYPSPAVPAAAALFSGCKLRAALFIHKYGSALKVYIYACADQHGCTSLYYNTVYTVCTRHYPLQHLCAK